MDAPNHRILVVDDDPEFRILIKHLLHQSFPNADVVEYDPVAEGQPDDDFDWSHYNLLILDYELNQPETGLDWLKTYKKTRGVPSDYYADGCRQRRDIRARAKVWGTRLPTQRGLERDSVSRDHSRSARVSSEGAIRTQRIGLREHNLQQSAVLHPALKQPFVPPTRTISKRCYSLNLDYFGPLTPRPMDSSRSTTSYATWQNNVANAFADDKPPLNVTRFGDTTIALLLAAGASDDEVTSIGRRLFEQLSNNPYKEDDTTIEYTVSIGATILRPAGHDSQRMFSQADKACRIARAKSGHSVHLYRDQDDAHVEEQDAQAETRETHVDNSKQTTQEDVTPQSDAATFDAEAAFKENRVLPYLQPVVAISETTQQLDEEFYEVRLRMVRLNGDIVEPAEFLPAVEQRKLQRMLDRWAIRECLGSLVQRERSKGRRLVFLLRLSRQTLTDDSLIGLVSSTLSSA